MNTLFISLDANGKPEVAMHNLMKSFGNTGYRNISWLPYYYGHKIRQLRQDIVALAKEFKPEFTFMQLQTEGILDADTLDQIPGFKMNWSGDVRDPTPRWYFQTARHVNVTCFTNDVDIARLRQNDLNCDYLQVGYDPEVYNRGCNCKRHKAYPSEYGDIVFLGNNYPGVFELSEARRSMVETLILKYPNFKVYGGNWKETGVADTRVLPPDEEVKAYNGCKIAISQNHFNFGHFSSDRIFRLMGSGAFCITNRFEGLEDIAEEGKHLVAFSSQEELHEKIDYYLTHDTDRVAIANNGWLHVRRNHTWQSRKPDIVALIEKYK